MLQLTPVGSTIFKKVLAEDADAGVNALIEYYIAPGDGTGIGNSDGVGRDRVTTADGYGFFSINLPHQGQVTVNRTLDYERTQRYLVTILASVRFSKKKNLYPSLANQLAISGVSRGSSDSTVNYEKSSPFIPFFCQKKNYTRMINLCIQMAQKILS